MKEFQHHTVVVTGGASGIGAACCRRFAAEGARVAVVDQDTEGARRTAAEVGGWSGQADVSSRAQLESVAAAIEREVGQPTVLIACAGIVQDPLPPDQLPQDTFDRVLDVNLRGTYLACAVFGAAMARRHRGAIVAVASVAGMRSMPLYAYSPAKAGIISLVEGLAGEWGRAGVRVNAISPGYTVTPALEEQIRLGYRDPDTLRRQSALGELIRPEHIADAVLFLSSMRAAMITGINLPVDAGWLVSGSWQTFGGVRGSQREAE